MSLEFGFAFALLRSELGPLVKLKETMELRFCSSSLSLFSYRTNVCLRCSYRYYFLTRNMGAVSWKKRGRLASCPII